MTERERLSHAGSLSVGDTGPVVEVANLDRQDFVKYAGASGDFNPIHYSEPFAEMAGYDEVFGQGMLTAGIAAQAVTAWFGVETLQQYSVRFESQLWPGESVTAVAEVTAIERSGETATVTVDIEATDSNETVLLTGEATTRLPADEDSA